MAFFRSFPIQIKKTLLTSMMIISLSLFCPSVYSYYYWYVITESIDKFGNYNYCGNNSCNIDASELKCSNSRAYLFRDKMHTDGHYLGSYYEDCSVYSSDFHEDRDFNGRDRVYFDNSTSNIGWYSGHGTLWCYNGHPDYTAPMIYKIGNTYKCPIDSSSDCWFDAECMRLGEASNNYYGSPYPGYENYIFVDTCCSLTLDVISDLWDQTEKGIHMIGGFNNVTYEYHNSNGTCLSSYKNEASDFAGQVNVAMRSISDAWLSELRDGNDNCPVIIANDNSSSNCSNRLYNENWKIGWADPSSNNYRCYTYWANCNGADLCVYPDNNPCN